jgi:CheY-like chemotaxis protein
LPSDLRPAVKGDGKVRDISLRVLIVEDCKDNGAVLAILLRSWGHEVRLAHDGAAALEACQSFRPQAVLLDISLPGMDGWELGRRLRQHEGMADALLIALTGHGLDQDHARSREAGLDAHLTKPAEPAAIQRLLAAATEPAAPACP